MDFFLCYPTPCKARARTPAPSVGRCTGTSRPDLGVRAQLHRRRSARASRRGERAARRSMWQVDPVGSSSVLRRAWSRPQRGGGKVRVGKKGRSTDELKGVRASTLKRLLRSPFSGSPGFYSARFGSAVLAPRRRPLGIELIVPPCAPASRPARGAGAGWGGSAGFRRARARRPAATPSPVWGAGLTEWQWVSSVSVGLSVVSGVDAGSPRSDICRA